MDTNTYLIQMIQGLFREAFADHPELFGQVADWGEVTIFERVPRY
mgnify:CR=1 FL=1